MADKKKMAIICSTDFKSYPLGGMMSFILDSIPYLKDHFTITLWGVSSCDEVIESIKIGNQVYDFKTFARVKQKNKIIPNFFKVIFGIWKKRKSILKDNYDIIYIHGIPLSFPFFNKNVKVVNHIHGMTNPFAMTANKLARNLFSITLYEKYRNWIVKKSDLIFLASDKKGHKQFSNRFKSMKSKIKYLPNFADTSIFEQIDSLNARRELNLGADEIIFVNTGRVGLQKDPILLVQSFIRFMNKNDINARLVIIGDGELRNEVEKIVENAKMNASVMITGKLDRTTINLWLNAADLYVYTSHANGFPISLAEAAICGLPIVTTDVTGVHDLVVNNLSGILVNSRNPEDIALAIEIALKNKQKYGEEILKISKDFLPGTILERLKGDLNSLS